MKLIESLEDISGHYKKYKTIAELVEKLVGGVRGKVQVIKEYAVLSYQLENINRKIPIGIHPLMALEADSAKHREEARMTVVRTPKSSAVRRAAQRVSLFANYEEEKKSSTVAGVRVVTIKSSETDLRRTALTNATRSLNESTFSKNTSSFSSHMDVSNTSFLDHMDDASNTSLYNTSSQQIISSHLSKSVPLLFRKPFDRTVGEEQMETIFKGARKPPPRRISFEEELMMEHEFEEDERLSNSCVLDYSLETCGAKKAKILRSNSMMIAEIPADDDTSVSKARK